MLYLPIDITLLYINFLFMRSWAAILCTIYSSSHFQEFSLSFSWIDKLVFVSLIILWEIYHEKINSLIAPLLPSVCIGHKIYSFSFRDANSDTDSGHRWMFQHNGGYCAVFEARIDLCNKNILNYAIAQKCFFIRGVDSNVIIHIIELVFWKQHLEYPYLAQYFLL